MTTTISYEYDHKIAPHYFAVVTLEDGTKAFRGGNNWNEARERMIKDLPTLFFAGDPPTPETVEVGTTEQKVWGAKGSQRFGGEHQNRLVSEHAFEKCVNQIPK